MSNSDDGDTPSTGDTPSSLSASQTIGGPADADAMHTKSCDDLKKKFESFYGLNPLGIGYSELFDKIC